MSDSGTNSTQAAGHAVEGELTPAAPSSACTAGQEVALELLLQSCRLSGTQWQPGNVLACAAWTFLAACLTDQPQTLGQSLEDVDVEKLDVVVLHGLQQCMSQSPKPPALWPDTLLWWYLLLAAKVCLCTALTMS